MTICTLSVRKNSSFMKTLFLFAASCLILGALSFSACKMDDSTDYSVEGFDENLLGVWKFDSMGFGGEEIVFEKRDSEIVYEYYSVSNYGDKRLMWKGYLRYAVQLNNDTGAFVIEYQDGFKQVWPDSNSWHETPPGSGMWAADPLDPQPKGNYYGIYYHSLGRVPERGNRWEVFIAHTSDQHNNYGPTETETLDQAKAKFTEENIRDLINLEVGDPQYKE